MPGEPVRDASLSGDGGQAGNPDSVRDSGISNAAHVQKCMQPATSCARARPVVYVAGPLTQGDVMANTRRAILAGQELAMAGFAPVVPHLSILAEMIAPLDYETWLACDLAILSRCDAVLRLPGISPGADRETERAALLGIPVIGSVEALRALLPVRDADGP